MNEQAFIVTVVSLFPPGFSHTFLWEAGEESQQLRLKHNKGRLFLHISNTVTIYNKTGVGVIKDIYTSLVYFYV